MRFERWIVLLAAMAAAAGTARLGWWQLDRAAQKTASQQRFDERQGLPTLDGASLARSEAEALEQHQRGIVLRGHWLASATVALDNRQMKGQPGFFVVTPLQLADGSAVLVQRGWLPRNFQDRSLVKLPALPEGEVQVQGRIAPPPGRLYEFGGESKGVVRQNLRLPEFAREIRMALRPLSVLQLRTDPPDGLQREWPAAATGVQKHHGYAFQWFALCLLIVGLYVWFQILRPRRLAKAPSLTT
jgi:surfeit locus 1 family protein